jgi:hypothetical protein
MPAARALPAASIDPLTLFAAFVPAAVTCSSLPDQSPETPDSR